MNLAIKFCSAIQVIALLTPLTMRLLGHRTVITTEFFGPFLAVAAFSKAIEGILRKRINIRTFEFTPQEGIGDYWLGILFWVGFGMFGIYLALR